MSTDDDKITELRAVITDADRAVDDLLAEMAVLRQALRAAEAERNAIWIELAMTRLERAGIRADAERLAAAMAWCASIPHSISSDEPGICPLCWSGPPEHSPDCVITLMRAALAAHRAQVMTP